MDGSPSAGTVPICIRCGYFSSGIVLVTDPNNVTYVANAQDIVNTTDTIITNNGLLLTDPASSFPEGETIRCNYNDGIMSGSYVINIEIFSELEIIIVYCINIHYILYTSIQSSSHNSCW